MVGLVTAYPVLSIFFLSFSFVLIIAQVHVLLSFSIPISLFIERILTSEPLPARCQLAFFISEVDASTLIISLALILPSHVL